LWGANGVTVVSAATNLSGPVVTDDSMGGAIVAWNDSRDANLDIYAQRIDASGAIVWPAGGVYVSTHWQPGKNPALADQWNPQIVSDQFGGAVITYNDLGGWNTDVSATRLDGDGNAIWSQWIRWDGESFAEPGYKQKNPKILFDGSGPLPAGAIILWQENAYPYDRYYAQKVVIDDSPPANDNCADAKVITDGQYKTKFLFRGSNDGSSSCGQGALPDVWYAYTAAQKGVLKLNTCMTHDLGGVDNGMDSVLSVHSACPGSQANEIACNDNDSAACPGKDLGLCRDSALAVALDAGQSVLIRVSMASDHVPGTVFLNVALEPKP
jgi:hypothetical protein